MSKIDYAYSVIGIIIGLVMVTSPRTLMRKAKYDEESEKTEKLVKKIGIVLIALAVASVAYFYLK